MIKKIVFNFSVLKKKPVWKINRKFKCKKETSDVSQYLKPFLIEICEKKGEEKNAADNERGLF